MESETVTIKVPRGLPTMLAGSSRHRKAVSLLLYFRAYNDAGRFKNTKKNQLEWAKLMGISYNTYLTYTTQLAALHLLEEKDGCIYFASKEKILDHFKLKNKGNYHVLSSGLRGAGKRTRLEDVLEAFAIAEDHAVNKAAFYYNLSNHPEVKDAVRRVVGSLNREEIHISQLDHFLDYYETLDRDDAVSLNAFNADKQINYHSLWDLFWYNSRGGFAYKKRKLITLRLIAVEPRYRLLQCHKTKESRRVMMGTINYDPRVKSPVLHLPDLIKPLPLKHAA